MPYPEPVRNPGTWHDDVARGADALEHIARLLERVIETPEVLEAFRVARHQQWLQDTHPGVDVTPSWDDDDMDEELPPEPTVPMPGCQHSRQTLRSNGDVGCADCPHVIIPKTGYNAAGGPNLPATES